MAGLEDTFDELAGGSSDYSFPSPSQGLSGIGARGVAAFRAQPYVGSGLQQQMELLKLAQQEFNAVNQLRSAEIANFKQNELNRILKDSFDASKKIGTLDPLDDQFDKNLQSLYEQHPYAFRDDQFSKMVDYKKNQRAYHVSHLTQSKAAEQREAAAQAKLERQQAFATFQSMLKDVQPMDLLAEDDITGGITEESTVAEIGAARMQLQKRRLEQQLQEGLKEFGYNPMEFVGESGFNTSVAREKLKEKQDLKRRYEESIKLLKDQENSILKLKEANFGILKEQDQKNLESVVGQINDTTQRLLDLRKTKKLDDKGNEIVDKPAAQAPPTTDNKTAKMAEFLRALKGSQK